MKLLEERIQKDGIVREGNVLKVDSFINHQMDIPLFREMAKEWKRLFAGKPVNKVLTIDVIYGKKYRKTTHVLKLEDMEVTAPHWHEKVAKYKKNTGTEKLKKYDYTSYEADTPYYTMIVKEDGHKIKLLLDLTEEMLHTMKTQFPEKVYFA